MSSASSSSSAIGGTVTNGFKISTELLPCPEGGGKACCLLSDERTVVTGGDDRMVTLWEPTEADPTMHVCPEAEKSIRDIVMLPPRIGGFIEQAGGGFATASLDKKVRIYSAAGECLMALEGHSGGVISLDVPEDGKLLSGSWDGTARLWSILEAKCVAVLGDHENGVSVAALNSDIVVTGSTGRKNENNQHVDYKIRFWQLRDPQNNQYDCIKVLEDHNQAIRSVCAIPKVGWASGSNDGTVRVRTDDGTALKVFENSLTTEGTPAFVFKVCYLPYSQELATCNENQTVTIFSLDTLQMKESITVPGTPWKVSQVPNGDVLIACDQAGTSRQGHYLLFSRIFEHSAEGKGDTQMLNNFAEYCKPPKKEADSGTGGGGSGEPNIKSWGHYDTRSQIPGTEDGKYGFFHKDDGSIWACMWSASSGQWIDIGQVTGAPSQEENYGAGGKQRGPDGKLYDIVRPVEVEGGATPSTLTLAFNLDEDPVEVAQKFCVENNLSMEMYEQVRDFVIQQRMQCGLSAAPATTSNQLNLQHLPVLGYATFHNFKPTAAVEKIIETNNNLTGEEQQHTLTLDDSNAEWKALRNVVEKTSFYHSSKFSPPAGKILLKLLSWPSKYLAPVIDILRMLTLHDDASIELPKILNVPETLHKKMVDDTCPAGAKIIAMRAMSNCFGKLFLRRQLIENMNSVSKVLEYALDNGLSDQMKPKLLLAATTVALNGSIAFHEEDIGEDAASGLIQWSRQLGQGSIDLSEQAIQNVATALGNIAHKNKDLVKSAQGEEIVDSLISRLGGSPSTQVNETLEETRKLLDS